MRIFDTRALVGFTLGAGVAVACTVAGASFAQQPAPRAPAAATKAAVVTAAAQAPSVITTACADKKTGVVTIIGGKHKKCSSKEVAISFASGRPGPAGPQGPQGAAGTGGGSILQPDGSLVLSGDVRFVSTNGAYILALTDDGLGLKGPGGSVVIDPFSLSTVNNEKQAP